MVAPLINKRIIHSGNKALDFADGTKVTFHVKVDALGEEEVQLDDSRSWKEPIELIFGKKFKLECWETCIRTMCLNEVASFDVDKSLVVSYPFVAKTLRDHDAKGRGKKIVKSTGCCGLAMNEGIGYEDLDELIKKPRDLRFTIELIKCELPDTYEKDYWAMSESEQKSSIETLKTKGNNSYKSGNHSEAAKLYAEALGRLENMILKEKPREEEWTNLMKLKIPLLLNYAQCQHLADEHYSVIEHCCTVLEHEPDNVKALFRRGRAYIHAYSPEEGRRDLQKAMSLDKGCAAEANKLLKKLAASEKEKMEKDKELLKNLFGS